MVIDAKKRRNIDQDIQNAPEERGVLLINRNCSRTVGVTYLSV